MKNLLVSLLLTILFVMSGCTSDKNKKSDYSYYYEKGKNACDSLNYSEAIDYFDKSIELNSDTVNNKSYVLRGECYLKSGRLDLALSEFNYLIKNREGNYSYYLGRGKVYYSKKKYEDALADFNKAIVLNNNNAEVYIERANTLNIMKEHKEALESINKALILDPVNKEAIYSRALIYYENEDYDKALNDFLDYCTKDPNKPIVNFFIGEIYNGKEKYELAQSYLTKSIDLNMEGVYALAQRSLAFVRLHKYDEAIADLSKAISIDSNSANLYVSRGNIYYEIYSLDIKAINDWRKAFEIDPSKKELIVKMDKANKKIESRRKL
ncbi:MAG: tetratricopeptide repeat protein [Bacteroidales bacterium]